ncbi:hypothetical protein D3C77_434330 [compost metagenome]
MFSATALPKITPTCPRSWPRSASSYPRRRLSAGCATTSNTRCEWRRTPAPRPFASACMALRGAMASPSSGLLPSFTSTQPKGSRDGARRPSASTGRLKAAPFSATTPWWKTRCSGSPRAYGGTLSPAMTHTSFRFAAHPNRTPARTALATQFQRSAAAARITRSCSRPWPLPDA